MWLLEIPAVHSDRIALRWDAGEVQNHPHADRTMAAYRTGSKIPARSHFRIVSSARAVIFSITASRYAFAFPWSNFT
jgi:hypothetical protein